MSKVATSLAFLVVGGGTCVTGAYALGAFASREVRFKTLKEFKDANGGKRVKGFFGEEIKLSVADTTGTITDPFFSTGDADKAKHKSSLLVDWQKNSYKDNKWDGIFTLTWLFLNKDDKGMIVFTSIRTSKAQNNQLDLDAAAYLLAKEGNEGSKKWNIKHKKEIPAASSSKTISNSDFDEHFPKSGTGIQGLEETNKSYWGFVSGSADVNNICKDKTCQQGKSYKHFRKEWSWKGDTGSATLGGWSDNLDWLDKVFADWKLKDKLQNFTGVWTLKS